MFDRPVVSLRQDGVNIDRQASRRGECFRLGGRVEEPVALQTLDNAARKRFTQAIERLTAEELAKVEPDVQILLCTIQLSTYVVKEAEKRGIQGAVSKSKASEITDGIAALLRHETFYSRSVN